MLTELIDKQIIDLDLPTVKYRRQAYKDPIERTIKILKDDVAQGFTKTVKRVIQENKNENELVSEKEKGEGIPLYNILPEEKEIWPNGCDILIVGGGVVGMSIAYHLKHLTQDGLEVVVLEKDSGVSYILKYILIDLVFNY